MGESEILKIDDKMQILNTDEQDLMQQYEKDSVFINALFTVTGIRKDFIIWLMIQDGEHCSSILKNCSSSHFTN